jgi:hypothetical protein
MLKITQADPPTPNLLAEFAEAFAIVKAKHPGSPGLPEGYEIRKHQQVGLAMYYKLPNCTIDIVPLHAALALCVVTVDAIVGYVNKNTRTTVNIWRYCAQHHAHLVAVEVLSDEGRHLLSADFATLESACLAALRAMGETK